MVNDIYHRVLDPELLSTPYATEQVQECGLVPVVTDSNLPAFATHNFANQDFTVSTLTDLGLIGSYTVTVTSEITFWSDYTKSS